MKKKKILWAGIFITGFFLLILIVSFFYTPYNPNTMNGKEKFLAPCWTHWMGTDNFGRDIFSRVLAGLSTTFFVGISVTGIGAVFGTILGAFTGYFGGWLDEILMRINDALTAFPSILLALVFISILGTGKYNIILALGIIFIPSFARIVRGEFIRLKELDYVKSAKLMGALLSAITVGFNNAVLAEAGMSYLGIGVQPPDASLGKMLSEAQSFLFSAPWYVIFPGIVIILLILGFSFLSEGIGT